MKRGNVSRFQIPSRLQHAQFPETFHDAAFHFIGSLVREREGQDFIHPGFSGNYKMDKAFHQYPGFSRAGAGGHKSIALRSFHCFFLNVGQFHELFLNRLPPLFVFLADFFFDKR